MDLILQLVSLFDSLSPEEQLELSVHLNHRENFFRKGGHFEMKITASFYDENENEYKKQVKKRKEIRDKNLEFIRLSQSALEYYWYEKIDS